MPRKFTTLDGVELNVGDPVWVTYFHSMEEYERPTECRFEASNAFSTEEAAICAFYQQVQAVRDRLAQKISKLDDFLR